MRQREAGWDLRETVAAHDEQIVGLRSDIGDVRLVVNDISQKLDGIKDARQFSWQTVSAVAGLLAMAAYIGMQHVDGKMALERSERLADTRVAKQEFDDELKFAQREHNDFTDRINGNLASINVLKEGVLKTQDAVNANMKDSQTRSDLNLERLDRLASEIARLHKIVTKEDMPFNSFQQRGPRTSDRADPSE